LEEVLPSDTLSSFWGYPFIDFAALKLVGSSRGVLFLWDKSTFHLISSFCGDFSITCIGGFAWVFIGAYGPHMRVARMRFWEELCQIRNGWQRHWCVGGISMISCILKRRSLVACPSNSTEEFHYIINYCALRDLPLDGGDYLV